MYTSLVYWLILLTLSLRTVLLSLFSLFLLCGSCKCSLSLRTPNKTFHAIFLSPVHATCLTHLSRSRKELNKDNQMLFYLHYTVHQSLRFKEQHIPQHVAHFVIGCKTLCNRLIVFVIFSCQVVNEGIGTQNCVMRTAGHMTLGE